MIKQLSLKQNRVNKIPGRLFPFAQTVLTNLTTMTALIAVVGLTGCGRTAFNPAELRRSQVSPGGFSVAPKVDILVAVDDTGSMSNLIAQISQQVPGFLDGLEKKGWDYHFTMIPLTQPYQVQQVVGSIYDSNRGSSWKPPYPGAQRNGSGTLSASAFRLPDAFKFVFGSSNALSGNEPGFSNILSTLQGGLLDTNFLRFDDELFVVLTVGNGNDTSGVSICRRPQDGVAVSCSDGSEQSSYDNYKNQFQGFKANMKFFAAVSTQSSNSCLGASSIAGTRYMKMANDLGGKTFDICTQPMSQVFESLASFLQTKKVALKTRLLILDREPDPQTIKVTIYRDGDGSKPLVIPSDPVNGWTYAGYNRDVPTVYSSEYGTSYNVATGYVIELHGTSILSGNDAETVDFKDAQARTSVSN